MERNFIDTTFWITDGETEITTSEFFEGGNHYYKLKFGNVYGVIIPASATVLESLRAAAESLIAAYEKHEAEQVIPGS
jgi:hypothetical protein